MINNNSKLQQSTDEHLYWPGGVPEPASPGMVDIMIEITYFLRKPIYCRHLDSGWGFRVVNTPPRQSGWNGIPQIKALELLRKPIVDAIPLG
jgi:hypothetical protein